jgi:hypothetical protein
LGVMNTEQNERGAAFVAGLPEGTVIEFRDPALAFAAGFAAPVTFPVRRARVTTAIGRMVGTEPNVQNLRKDPAK